MNHSKRTRKLIALLIAAVMMFALLSGCGQGNTPNNNDGVYSNKKYADSGMLTINKDAFDYEKSIILKEAGFGMQLTDIIQELYKNGKIEPVVTKFTAYILYFTEKAKEQMSVDSVLRSYAISRIPSGNETELERIRGSFSNVEAIATIGDDTYYFAYNDDYSVLTTTEADKAELDLLISERETIKNGICLFPAESITMSSNINMRDFNTKTLNGEEFTQKDFADYDLTMVNIWTTWCGPCVEEMPDLQNLYGTLPENVNMITICADGNEESELAKQILIEIGCTFQTLVPDEKLQESLLKEVTGYPTTIFVDRNGNVVGEAAMGAGKNPAEAYRQMIEERLPMVVKGQ